jgi:nicotinic acid mononucleotide adenylyltransferase
LLNLVFYTQDTRLKVRYANAQDDFSKSCNWKDKFKFIVADSGDFTIMWTSFLPDLEPEYAEALVDIVSARFPVSENYELLRSLCPDMLFKNLTGEWVFFGGSFNPWHQGHQACLNLLPEDKVCLILPDKNPQKELGEIHQVTKLLEISTKAKFNKNQFITPAFLLKNKKNPTVEWIEKMKEDFPSERLSLLMGFDSFFALKTWIRVDELLPKLHTIYVVSRLENDEDRRRALDEVHARGPEVNVVFLGKHEYEDVSSTDLRKRKK